MPSQETEYSRMKAQVFELFRRAAAPMKHFEPVGFVNGALTDRFGNRIITSPNQAFLDRDEDLVKAAALVSPEGEEWFRRNKGLLKPIEQAVVVNEITERRGGKRIHEVQIAAGKILRRFYDKDGSQSKIYLLETEEEDMLLKKTQEAPPFFSDFNNQPYLYEMIQTQLMQRDVGEELADLGIYLPTYFFATGQLCGLPYYKGAYPDYDETEGQLIEGFEIVKRYIKEQNGDPIWKNVHVDEQARIDGDTSNFIQQEDGKMIWIDRFVCINSANK